MQQQCAVSGRGRRMSEHGGGNGDGVRGCRHARTQVRQHGLPCTILEIFAVFVGQDHCIGNRRAAIVPINNTHVLLLSKQRACSLLRKMRVSRISVPRVATATGTAHTSGGSTPAGPGNLRVGVALMARTRGRSRRASPSLPHGLAGECSATDVAVSLQGVCCRESADGDGNGIRGNAAGLNGCRRAELDATARPCGVDGDAVEAQPRESFRPRSPRSGPVRPDTAAAACNGIAADASAAAVVGEANGACVRCSTARTIASKAASASSPSASTSAPSLSAADPGFLCAIRRLDRPQRRRCRTQWTTATAPEPRSRKHALPDAHRACFAPGRSVRPSECHEVNVCVRACVLAIAPATGCCAVCNGRGCATRADGRGPTRRHVRARVCASLRVRANMSVRRVVSHARGTVCAPSCGPDRGADAATAVPRRPHPPPPPPTEQRGHEEEQKTRARRPASPLAGLRSQQRSRIGCAALGACTDTACAECR